MEIVDFRDAYSDFCLGRDERVKVDETSYGWELYIFFGSERGVRVPPPTDFVFLHSYYPPPMSTLEIFKRLLNYGLRLGGTSCFTIETMLGVSLVASSGECPTLKHCFIASSISHSIHCSLPYSSLIHITY